MPSSRREACAGVLLAGAILVGASACKEAPSPPERLARARHLASDLRLALNQAGDASGRAVLADTDATSAAFAADAVRAKKTTRDVASALAPVLRSLGFDEETRHLDAFVKSFDAYDALDRTVLELAVENTNLKAQRLSFGPVREAADALRRALDAVSGAQKPNECRISALASSAVLAVREIQVLHAPHIAEADDAAMTRMEKEMDALAATARGALDALSGLVDAGAKASVDDGGLRPPNPPGPRPAPLRSASLAAARAALDQFRAGHDQLIALSRKNTNVRSLILSLGQGRSLFTACDASLLSLSEQLAKRGSTATR